MDPRFKNRIDSDEIWDRVKNAVLKAAAATEQVQHLSVISNVNPYSSVVCC